MVVRARNFSFFYKFDVRAKKPIAIPHCLKLRQSRFRFSYFFLVFLGATKCWRIHLYRFFHLGYLHTQWHTHTHTHYTVRLTYYPHTSFCIRLYLHTLYVIFSHFFHSGFPPEPTRFIFFVFSLFFLHFYCVFNGISFRYDASEWPAM